MKIVDEKGKLFGIVNIVDLIVALVVIALVAGVGYKLVSRKINAGDGNILSKDEDVYVTLYSSLVVPEIAESLNVGDKLVANGQFTNAEIVDIKVEPAAYVATDANGIAVQSEHPLWKDVTVVVKDKVNPSNVILKVGGQETRVGYSYILKTQTVETNCKIRGVDFENPVENNSSDESETLSSEE